MAAPASDSYRALLNTLHNMACPRKLTVAEARSELVAAGYSVEPATGEDAMHYHYGAARIAATPTVPLSSCAEVVPADTLIKLDYQAEAPVCVPGGGKQWADCGAELFCHDGDDGDHTETVPTFGSQPTHTTPVWSNETTAGYNHPEQYFWRFAVSGNYPFYPDGNQSGTGRQRATGAASPGDTFRFDFTHRFGGSFAPSKTFRFRVEWLSGAYDSTAGGYAVIGTSDYDSAASSSLASHSAEFTAPFGTTAFLVRGNVLEPWNMHDLCITAV